MSQCPTDSYVTRVQRGTLYSGSRGIAVISATNTRTELDVYSTIIISKEFPVKKWRRLDIYLSKYIVLF